MPRVSKEELIKLQKTLQTDVAIAKKLGMCPSSVYKMRKTFAITSRFSVNITRNAQIIELYSKGTIGDIIADKFGITPSMVSKIAFEAGIRKRNDARQTPPEIYNKIIALYKQGIPGTSIADKLGLSFNHVYRLIRTAGAGKKSLSY
jgi:DNA invertase Pin-like site-specific DNA recombinase